MRVENQDQNFWNILDYKLDEEEGTTIWGNKHVLITQEKEGTQIKVVNNSLEAFLLYLKDRWEGKDTQWVSGKNLSQIKTELSHSDEKTSSVGLKLLGTEKSVEENADDIFREESLTLVKKQISSLLIKFIRSRNDPNYDELFKDLKDIEKAMFEHESYFNNRVESEPNRENEMINKVIEGIREGLISKDKDKVEKILHAFIPIDNVIEDKKVEGQGKLEVISNFDDIQAALEHKVIKKLRDLNERSESEGGVTLIYSKEFDELKLEIKEHNKKYGDNLFPEIAHPRSYFGKLKREGVIERIINK